MFASNVSHELRTPLAAISGSQYDPVHLEKHGKWHLPSAANFRELLTECSWTWDATYHGFVVTGTNGNSIFLPAGGYKRTVSANSNFTNEDKVSETGDSENLYYWTSTRSSEANAQRAYSLIVNADNLFRPLT